MSSNTLSRSHRGPNAARDGDNVIVTSSPGAAGPFIATTAGDMHFYLQNLLDRKEKQLQQAGNLGQRVLAQQMELEERVRQLQELVGDKADEEEVNDPLQREKYRELSDLIIAWDTENAQLGAVFSASSEVCPLQLLNSRSILSQNLRLALSD